MIDDLLRRIALAKQRRLEAKARQEIQEFLQLDQEIRDLQARLTELRLQLFAQESDWN